jgi:hypothetical protein
VEGRVWKVERRFEIASEHCETENLFSMNSEQWCVILFVNVLIVCRKLDGNEKYKKKDYKGAIGKECGNEMGNCSLRRFLTSLHRVLYSCY